MAGHALEVVGRIVRRQMNGICREMETAVKEAFQAQNVRGVDEDRDNGGGGAVLWRRRGKEALGLTKFAEGVREFEVVVSFEGCAEGEVERVAVDHVLNGVREEAEREGTLLEHVLDEDEVTLVLEGSILFAEPMVKDDIEFAGFVERTTKEYAIGDAGVEYTAEQDSELKVEGGGVASTAVEDFDDEGVLEERAKGTGSSSVKHFGRTVDVEDKLQGGLSCGGVDSELEEGDVSARSTKLAFEVEADGGGSFTGFGGEALVKQLHCTEALGWRRAKSRTVRILMNSRRSCFRESGGNSRTRRGDPADLTALRKMEMDGA